MTCIVDNVFYDSYPPPVIIVKAMKSEHARLCKDYGHINFGNLENYRSWENNILGDASDGHGGYKIDDGLFRRGTVNQVYAFCASFPTILKSRLELFAKSEGY